MRNVIVYLFIKENSIDNEIECCDIIHYIVKTICEMQVHLFSLSKEDKKNYEMYKDWLYTGNKKIIKIPEDQFNNLLKTGLKKYPRQNVLGFFPLEESFDICKNL